MRIRSKTVKLEIESGDGIVPLEVRFGNTIWGDEERSEMESGDDNL